MAGLSSVNFLRVFATLSIVLAGSWFTGCSMVTPPDGLTPVAGSASESQLGPMIALPELSKEEDTGELAVDGVFPEYNKAELPSETRILLVAGESSSPSYLNEVLAQRQHWMKLGYAPGEIACYYAKPSKKDYHANKASFDGLVAQTEGFYIAAPHLIYKHIRDISRRNPEFFYLYVTANGQAPISTYTAPNQVDSFLLKEFPDVTEQYFIDLDGGPSGTMNELMRAEALAIGFKPEQLFFMPRYLKSALFSLPTHCKKVVVLQGGYSGGFIDTPLKQASSDTLTAVPQITLLTSSRHDRRSFDGQPGKQFTPYGKVYLQMLSENARPITLMDWKAFSSILQQRVDDEEIMKSYAEQDLSYPRFYSNLFGDAPRVASKSLLGN